MKRLLMTLVIVVLPLAPTFTEMAIDRGSTQAKSDRRVQSLRVRVLHYACDAVSGVGSRRWWKGGNRIL